MLAFMLDLSWRLRTVRVVLVQDAREWPGQVRIVLDMLLVRDLGFNKPFLKRLHGGSGL